jgi:hypothetical protein
MQEEAELVLLVHKVHKGLLELQQGLLVQVPPDNQVPLV